MKKIAIIGIGCIFPDAETPEQFYLNLINGKDSIRDISIDKTGVDPKEFYSPKKGEAEKSYHLKGGFINNFNLSGTDFRTNTDELNNLDDSFKYTLYASSEALKDSGYHKNKSKLKNCGVIIGNTVFQTKKSRNIFLPYYNSVLENQLSKHLNQKISFENILPDEETDRVNATTTDFLTSVISDEFGCTGPSFTVDSACSSSLYALKTACDCLCENEADMMITGGVYGNDPITFSVGFSMLQAFPENGFSVPFDKDSQGLTMGEGAGILVLKRLEDAVRDKDKIYATIDGVGLSNDGRGKSFSTPDKEGQIRAFKNAFAHTGLKPEQVSYIECHATGTKVGDIVELEAVEQFYAKNNTAPKIGSLKANIGHLFGASAVAGIIKVVMSMKHEQLPPAINIKSPLQSEERKIGEASIIRKPTPFFKSDDQSIAVVNAFGFGGTNAAAVIEKYSPNAIQEPGTITVKKEPLAIVGIDSFFGSCKSSDDFEDSIFNTVTHFTDLPEKRWKGLQFEENILEKAGITDIPKGAYIDEFNLDIMKAKLAVKSIDAINPQQMLMFNVANNALENAGFDLNDAKNEKTAVIIASGLSNSSHLVLEKYYCEAFINKALEKANIILPDKDRKKLTEVCKKAILDDLEPTHIFSYTGNLIASRIASYRNFKGPSFVTASGESSVYKAIETAQKFINSGEADNVLVGAIDLGGDLESLFTRNKNFNIATNPLSLAIERNEDGTGIGEGAGAIVLTSLHAANKQKQTVYAVIEGIANIKGETDLLSKLPQQYDEKAVRLACSTALEKSSFGQENIDYIEITAGGSDAINDAEIKGLSAFYKRKDKTDIALGSAKSIIGDTFIASGMAAVIKTALCLYNQYIPGIPGWNEPKNKEAFKDTRFYFPAESHPWYPKLENRTGAINNISADGVYSHLILSEAESNFSYKIHEKEKRKAVLIPVAGKSKSEFLDHLQKLSAELKQQDIATVASRYYNRFIRSAGDANVLSLIGRSEAELQKEIQFANKYFKVKYEQGEDFKTPSGSYMTNTPLGSKNDIAFVYPGAFNSYEGMCRNLQRTFPLEIFHRKDRKAQELALINEALYPRSIEKSAVETNSLLENDTRLMVLSGINVSLQYTQILKNYFNITPKAAFGYSLGESSMLVANEIGEYNNSGTSFLNSKIFTEKLGGIKTVVREKWQLPDSEKFVWDIYVLMCDKEKVNKVIKNYSKVYITHVNTPREIIIAGDPTSCKALIKQLDVEYMHAPFNDVLHCELVNSVAKELFELANTPVKNESPVKFYSASNCNVLNITSNDIAESYVHMLSSPIDFPKLVDTVYKNENIKLFIEIGAGNTCTAMIKENLSNREHAAVSINNKGVDDYFSILKLLAILLSHKVPMDISALYAAEQEGKQVKKGINKPFKLFSKTIAEELNSTENRKFFDYLTRSISEKEIDEENHESEPETVIYTGDIAFPGTKHCNEITANLASFFDMQNAFLQYRSKLAKEQAKQLKREISEILETSGK